MRDAIFALALSGMLTVEQGDSRRAHFDPPAASLSEDARFIAFTTFARLAPADLDDRCDVYVFDRRDQRVTLESAPLDGSQPSYTSHPALSGDGSLLIYEAGERIVLRDRRSGSTRVLGVGRQPVISGNGMTAAFTSDELSTICIVHTESRQVRCIGDTRGGASASITKDGRVIAFSAAGSIFVYDDRSRAVERVGSGWDPAISADGEWVAFVDRVDGLPAVFLSKWRRGTRELVSRSTTGGLANGGSINPAISHDGRIVVFQSLASNMVDSADYNLLWDVFVFDGATTAMTRLSGDPDTAWMESSGGPVLNMLGTVVAFSSRHPTDAADKGSDFDLFVAPIGSGGALTASEQR